MKDAVQGLGTKLRLLLGQLDGEVQQIYDNLGVPFRPRFYPVTQLLLLKQKAGVNEIAAAIGVSQPAATQTINEMKAAGLVVNLNSSDRRARLIGLSAEGLRLAGRLEPLWRAAHKAAAELDRELPMPLAELIEATLAALGRRPFAERIQSQLNKEEVGP